MTKLIAFGALLVGLCLCWCPLFGQTIWRIDSSGTMDDHPGYFQSMIVSGSLHETDFLFEENGYLRYYAYKMFGQSVFTALPDSTYCVKLESMNIGDSWTSWAAEPIIAIVKSTATISTPAGTFETFIVEGRLESNPDSTVIIRYFANNIGIVGYTYNGSTGLLSDYVISGGSGYYPLYVGNWWQMESTLGIEEQPINSKPLGYGLTYNAPNPFNPNTTIEYSLERRAHVIIEIFNLLGQKVRTLVDETKSAGQYRTEWNGQDESGKAVSSGVYLYRLQAGDAVQIRKMMLLK